MRREAHRYAITRLCLCAAGVFFAFAGLIWAEQDVIVDTQNIDDVNNGIVDSIDNDTHINIDTLAGIDTDLFIDSPALTEIIVTDTVIQRTDGNITDTVFYKSDFVDYDNVERVLFLYGRAWIKYQNVTLSADTIIYTVSNDQFQARGTPMLIESRDTTFGDFMAYNIRTRRGRVSYAVTRFDDTYVVGSNIVKSLENNLYIEQGDYTTCQYPENPHYYFYGRHIKIIPDDKVVSRPVVVVIADAPVAVLPYFVMPLQRGRRSGWLTPSWGGSLQRGGYVDNLGYYFAPNDYYDLVLSAKAQEFNSFVFNAGGRYALRYVLDGQVSGRYVLDNRLENTSQQWALDYRHNQLLTPDGRTRLSGQGSILSSRTFNQLYSDNTYELEQQQLNANMSLSHRFNRINASTNVTWRRNHNLATDRIIEDMPSFDFRLQNRAFLPFRPGGARSEPSWYNNIFYSYNTRANVRRDMQRDTFGNDSLGFIRSGMEHNVNLNSSQKMLKYLDVSPYFNMRASMFQGAIDTTIKETIFYRDTLIYTVRDPARDTRAPTYTLINVSPPQYFINDNGEPDTLYTITKVGPERRHLVRDTLEGLHTVGSWRAGVNLSTRIYGMFPTANLFGITALRHTLTPTVGYEFVPEHELDKTFYNIGINYDRARPKTQQLMNLSLSNRFEGKRIVGRRDNRRDSGADDRFRGDDGGIGSDNISVVDERLDDIDDDFTEIIVFDYPLNNIDDENDLDFADDFHLVDSENGATETGVPGPPAADRRVREQKFDLFTFNLNTAYDFEADSLKWRDLNLSAGTNIGILNVNHTSVYWLYGTENELILPTIRNYSFNLTSRSLGVAGRFWGGDLSDIEMINSSEPLAQNQVNTHAWNIGFSPSFSYRASRISPDDRFVPTKSFNLSSSASVNLTDAMSVRWSGNYDFSSNQFSHNNFTFHYDLECWEMRFTWRPEKINPGFHFVINIKKIPDFKWEERESRTTRVL
jgi:lipopolysaccharide assembly outer membrane protein LptD (OstA)